MIYRNSSMPSRLHWWPDVNPDACEIARNFLTGECELMQLTHTSGEILISVDPWSESLLLTGRTADVLSGYLDQKIVRMEDRFDMTVRHGVRST